MGRFLIYFSYFGTRYSGLQRQINLIKGKHHLTVQDALQDALGRLKPANDPTIILSSRTDKGVHSLKNACHVDLEYPEEGKEYDPEIITCVMNYDLEKALHDIRVLETRHVPPSFHARLSAQERKYVYRLAHNVGESKTEEERQVMVSELKKYFFPRHKHSRLPERDSLPVADACRVRTYRNTLDISKLISAAEVCSGIHNFSSFTRPIKFPDYSPNPVKMLTIGVKRGQPFARSLNALGHNTTAHMEYWDIHVRSRSFLYRQVRRLVGGMVLVAMNKISVGDLKDILDNPRVNYPFAGQMGMEESGLFLVDVGYDPEDLKFEDSQMEKVSHNVTPTATDDSCYADSSIERTKCTEDGLISADENHGTNSMKQDKSYEGDTTGCLEVDSRRQDENNDNFVQEWR